MHPYLRRAASPFVLLALIAMLLPTFSVQAQTQRLFLTGVTPEQAIGTIGQSVTIEVNGGTAGPGVLIVYIRNKLASSSIGPYITSDCIIYGTPQSRSFNVMLNIPSPESSFPYVVGAFFRPDSTGCTINQGQNGDERREMGYTIIWNTPSQNTPTLLKPTNGATVHTPSPTLHWTEVRYASEYIVRVNESDYRTTATSFTAPLSFAANQDVTWFVRAVFSGQAGPASNTFTFRYVPTKVRVLASDGQPLTCAKTELLMNGEVVAVRTTDLNGSVSFNSIDSDSGATYTARVTLEHVPGIDCGTSFFIIDNRPQNGATTPNETPAAFEREIGVGTSDIEMRAGDSSISVFHTINSQSFADLAAIYVDVDRSQHWTESVVGRMPPEPLKVFAFNDDDGVFNAAYLPSDYNISLGTGYSESYIIMQGSERFNPRQDTIYHEHGHRIHNQLTRRFVYPNGTFYPDGTVGHGGADNTSSVAGYAEGFAQWQSTMLQGRPYVLYRAPDVVVDISNDYRWNALSTPMTSSEAEEFAITGILWDIAEAAGGINEATARRIWLALPQSPHENGMVGVYESLSKNVVSLGISQAQLDAIFITHGFFEDLNGNGQHDAIASELFIDKNGDGVYTAEEEIDVNRNGQFDTAAPERIGYSIDTKFEHLDRMYRGSSPAFYGVQLDVVGDQPTSYEISIQGIAPNPSSSYSYTVPATSFPDGLVKLYPPPPHYDATVSIRALTASGSTNSFEIKSQAFWSVAAQHVQEPLLGSFTLTVGATAPALFDTTSPVSKVLLSGTTVDGHTFTTAPVFQVAASDDRSGVKEVECNVNGAGWIDCSKPTAIPAQGDLTVEVRAIDFSGNTEVPQVFPLRTDYGCYTTSQRSSNSGKDRLLRFSSFDGSVVAVGETGYRIADLAFQGETLFASLGWRLARINNRGEITPLSAGFGKGRGIEGKVTFSKVEALIYNPVGRFFYGLLPRNGKPDLLITINPGTGIIRSDGFGPGVDYIAINGLVPETDIDGLVIDNSGRLLGLSTNKQGSALLIEINSTDGTATLIGDTGVANVSELSSGWDGSLYLISTPSRSGDPTNYRIYRVDATNGVAEEVLKKPYKEIPYSLRTHAGVACYQPPAQDAQIPTAGVSVSGGKPATTTTSVAISLTSLTHDFAAKEERLLIKEYALTDGQWSLTQERKLRTYGPMPRTFNWKLTTDAGPGVRYIEVYAVGANDGITAALGQSMINYQPRKRLVEADEIDVYRVYLIAGQRLDLRLEKQWYGGDADLYLWAPDYPTRSAWISNGLSDEQISVNAPVTGVYQIEVEGISEGAYTLHTSVTFDPFQPELSGSTDPTKSSRNAPAVDLTSKPSP